MARERSAEIQNSTTEPNSARLTSHSRGGAAASTSQRKTHRVPMVNGDEYDAFTSFRRFLGWRAGERKQIKRAYNRRQRRALCVEVSA